MAILIAVGCFAAIACAQPGTSKRAAPAGARKPPPTDGPEWTAFSPSVDSVLVYVSNSTGNDAFSGLSPSQPKKTIAAGAALIRDGFPDWLLLNRGDTWSEPVPSWDKGGRSVSEPQVIGSYGVGARPLLNTGSGNGFFASGYPVLRSHLAVTDLHFVCDRGTGVGTEAGLTILNLWSDVLVENCMFESYPNNIVIQEAGIGRPSNIRLRRCVVVDAFRSDGAHSAGIFAGGVDGLLVEECIFDHNGWRRGVSGANANIFNHNMYLHEASTGVVTRGNVTTRASATGILQRAGGISENNLCLGNPVAIFHGQTDQPGVQARGAVRNNVILDSRDIASDTLRGFGIWLGASRNTDVYGNVIAHQRTGSGNVNGITVEGAMVSVAVYRNIVYDWSTPTGSNGSALAANLTTARGISITDNQFQQVQGGFLIDDAGQPPGDVGSLFGRNCYFTANQPPHQFFYGVVYSGWLQMSGEPWSTFVRTHLPAPERTIETYMASLGMEPTLDAFVARARLQERMNWDVRFTANTVNNYIRQGFGVGQATCRADFNSDGAVNILDFAAFSSAVSVGDPRADVNLDGVINLTDNALFQSLVTAGCP